MDPRIIEEKVTQYVENLRKNAPPDTAKEAVIALGIAAFDQWKGGDEELRKRVQRALTILADGLMENLGRGTGVDLAIADLLAILERPRNDPWFKDMNMMELQALATGVTFAQGMRDTARKAYGNGNEETHQEG